MPINYTEKGHGLHEKLLAAGHWIECRDGVHISSNDAVVQAICDSYTATEAANLVKKAVRALAEEKEDDILSEREQVEMLSRRIELQDIKDTRALTTAEQAEIDSIKAEMAKIRAIREARRTHIQALNALAAGNNFAAILSYKIKQGWPAKG